MSERSFSRRYAEATGLTPARAVERLRVGAASQLLSDTGLPAKGVAERCGLSYRAYLRPFRQAFPLPPNYPAVR
jgi:transcriptional regulator GlxA family with amidase domain